jgi:hypothetical protein
MCTAELNPKFGLQKFILFNPDDIHYLVTNSESQVIFYHWVSFLFHLDLLVKDMKCDMVHGHISKSII